MTALFLRRCFSSSKLNPGPILTQGPIRFDDPETAYSSYSSFELVRALGIYKACSVSPLVRNAEKLYKLSLRVGGSRLTHSILKHSLFAHFCAGEDEYGLNLRMSKLSSIGVGCILDYAAEAGVVDASDHFEENTYNFLKAIDLASNSKSPVAVKISGLAPLKVLEQLTVALSKSDFNFGRTLPNLEGLGLSSTVTFEVSELLKRLDKICSLGKSRETPILIDAEWTEVQGAIDYLAILMMNKFNRGGHQIISTTYQCYLTSAPNRVKRDISLAQKLQFSLCAKVVRGAYLVRERELGNSRVCPDAETTSMQYHSVLSELARTDVVKWVLVASHNETSIKETIRLIQIYPSKFKFAQLLGMGDSLSFPLASRKFQVYKYVPFGPVELVVPYLLRRAQENSSLMGSPQVSKERELIVKELRRRFRAWASAWRDDVKSNSLSLFGRLSGQWDKIGLRVKL